MATILTVGTSANGSANLCTAQTGNGPTTNIADRGLFVGPALLRIITTVGGGPTCTYLIEGSANGVDWFAQPYADPSAAETMTIATFAITTATTTLKFIRVGHPSRFLRVTFSLNTNVTNTVDLWTLNA